MTNDDKFPYAEIGDRLRAFRESFDVTSKEFATMHNFAYSRYSNWETGHRRISIEAATLLRDKYDLTLDYIYLGKESAALQNALKLAKSRQAD